MKKAVLLFVMMLTCILDMQAKGYPVLSDMYLTPTPADPNASSIKNVKVQKNAGNLLRSEYFNIQGQHIKPDERRIYIRRDVYDNGTSKSQKLKGPKS